MPKSFDNPKILAAQFRIKHKDIFNINQFYVTVHEWLKEKQWNDIESSTEGDYHESFYMDKTGIYGDKEIWAWWRMEQFPHGEAAGNPFFKWHLDIDFHFMYVKDTELMVKGKKIASNEAEIEIKIWAWIEMDYNQEWSKHPFMKFFLDVFRLRIFYSDLLKHKYELYREAFTLQGMIKKFLALRGFLPEQEREAFHEPHGVPEGEY